MDSYTDLWDRLKFPILHEVRSGIGVTSSISKLSCCSTMNDWFLVISTPIQLQHNMIMWLVHKVNSANNAKNSQRPEDLASADLILRYK